MSHIPLSQACWADSDEYVHSTVTGFLISIVLNKTRKCFVLYYAVTFSGVWWAYFLVSITVIFVVLLNNGHSYWNFTCFSSVHTEAAVAASSHSLYSNVKHWMNSVVHTLYLYITEHWYYDCMAITYLIHVFQRTMFESWFRNSYTNWLLCGCLQSLLKISRTLHWSTHDHTLIKHF